MVSHPGLMDASKEGPGFEPSHLPITLRHWSTVALLRRPDHPGVPPVAQCNRRDPQAVSWTEDRPTPTE